MLVWANGMFDEVAGGHDMREGDKSALGTQHLLSRDLVLHRGTALFGRFTRKINPAIRNYSTWLIG